MTLIQIRSVGRAVFDEFLLGCGSRCYERKQSCGDGGLANSAYCQMNRDHIKDNKKRYTGAMTVMIHY